VADSACFPPGGAPIITTSYCESSAFASYAGWSAVPGATSYDVRINDTTAAAWNGTCSTPGNPNGGNYCANIGGTSTAWTGISGHTYDWWVHSCNAGGCSEPAYSSFTCPVPPTPTNTPTPTPNPIPVVFSYYKLKDASFYKIGDITSDFPPVITAYDTSDTIAGGYFNQGQAGMILATGSRLSAGAGGSAISGSSANPRNWTKLIAPGGNSFTPSSFLTYVKSKKNTTTVATIGDLPTSGMGGTYSITSTSPITISGTAAFRSYITIIVNGDLTLSSTDIGKDGVVFLVTGNVTVEGAGSPVKFNGVNRPFAAVSTGTITFADSLTEADGLFVGNAINFGSGTTPLKIVGNVSSVTASTPARDRPTTQASMFIVFDPRHYAGTVDRISTVKSSWTQLQ